MQVVTLLKNELTYEMNEEMKVLRTNIQFSGSDKRVILFTSSQAGEGKSTTTLELAKSMTELGKRVLLIDADLRKSMLKHRTENPRGINGGLTYYLSGMMELGDVLCKTDVPQLYMIFAGPVPPNPSELLASNRMGQLLDSAKKQFDYVLVDCAPLNMVIDAAVLAPKCDGAAIVIEAEAISRRAAAGVVERIRSTGCPIIGVILSKVSYHSRSGYYKRYYRKYDYKYEKDESKKKGLFANKS